MNKFKNFLFVVIAATVVIACSSDYEFNAPEIEIPEVTEAISFTEDELLVLTQMRNPGNRICIDEATAIALEALDLFGGRVSTRSGQARTIAGVTALQNEPATRVATRSADGNDVEVQMPDTVAFVFNFANDEGFTIVAADTRITSPVLAFVEDGNLDLSQEIDHPGLAVFFAGLEEYIEGSIIEAEELRKELIAGILEKLGKNVDTDTETSTRWSTWGNCPNCWQPIEWCWCPPCCRPPSNYLIVTEVTVNPLGPWVTTVRGPLLPVEWHQGFPFNDLIKHNNCPAGTAPAGCVAVAIAQIMTFWGHPAQIDVHPMNWNLLRGFTARPNAYSNVMGKQGLPVSWAGITPESERGRFINNVSRLMERIGVGVGMNYGCGSSGADTREKTLPFLRGLGYSGDNLAGFNTQAVVNSLNNNRPVLARGNSSRTESVTKFLGIVISRNVTYGGGHAWVIDGHLRQHRPITTTFRTYQDFGTHRILIDSFTTAPTTEWSATFLHNNWGWSGAWPNGFFTAGSFNTNRSPNFGSGTRSSTPGNYQFRNEVFTNIRR
jgi:hypothetical protein